MDSLYEELGRILAIARKQSNVSQDTVAAFLNTNRQKIYKIEHGKCEITILEFKKYCEIVRMSHLLFCDVMCQIFESKSQDEQEENEQKQNNY